VKSDDGSADTRVVPRERLYVHITRGPLISFVLKIYSEAARAASETMGDGEPVG
jgi:hypothetical protein